MRRIKPTTGGSIDVRLPVAPPSSGGVKGLFARTSLVMEGTSVHSECLACPDTPCMRFGPEEVAAPVSVETPVAPDSAVCPTDAMGLGEDGVPMIEEALCIGCGLCVTRCPVGAISLDADAGLAGIENDAQGAYVSAPHDPGTFAVRRAELASLLTPEQAPYSDAYLVQVQMSRLDALAVPGSLQRVYRLLARNTFLSLGLPARLKNPGDNNAVAELAVSSEATLVLVEVEPNGGVLDAFRRVISGVAIVRSRYGVGESDVIPCVVMDRLPNVRVDYYEAVKNARDRIGVSVRSLPAAALLLGIRSGDDRLLRLIREYAVLDSLHPSMEAQAMERWGPVSGVGLSPAK